MVTNSVGLSVGDNDGDCVIIDGCMVGSRVIISHVEMIIFDKVIFGGCPNSSVIHTFND